MEYAACHTLDSTRLGPANKGDASATGYLRAGSSLSICPERECHPLPRRRPDEESRRSQPCDRSARKLRVRQLFGSRRIQWEHLRSRSTLEKTIGGNAPNRSFSMGGRKRSPRRKS